MRYCSSPNRTYLASCLRQFAQISLRETSDTLGMLSETAQSLGKGNMSEWLAGFTSGVIAIIIGFILTMLWDTFRFKRESKKREETVLSAVKEELVSNSIVLQDNQTLLQKELEIIDEEKGSVVSPLNLLQSGFWDLVKINLPWKLTKGDSLVKIRRVA